MGKQKQNQKGIKKLAADYADVTSIHGIRYIGEQGRHFLEK